MANKTEDGEEKALIQKLKDAKGVGTKDVIREMGAKVWVRALKDDSIHPEDIQFILEEIFIPSRKQAEFVKEGGIAAIFDAVKIGETNGAYGRRTVLVAGMALGNLLRRCGDIVSEIAENHKQSVKKGGIAMLLHAMEPHETSVGCVKAACFALPHLTKRLDTENQKQNLSDIAAILDAMERYKTSEDVQSATCRVLGNFAEDDAKLREHIANSGGVVAILNAMKTHETRKDVQDAACRALGNLDVVAVLNAMKTHKTSAIVQDAACGALEKLAAKGDAKLRKHIANSGGVVAILNAMKTHETCEDVQNTTCRALGIFAKGDAKLRKHIANSGGVVAILNAMKTHKTSASVHTTACQALGIFAKGDAKLREHIANSGGVVAILIAMKRHETSLEVQKRAVQALCWLAEDDAENQTQIAKCGGIANIFHAMKTCETSKDVQMYACRALRELARDNADVQEQIVKSGGITVILQAMETHKTSTMNAGPGFFPEAACEALGDLAYRNTEGQKQIAENDGIGAILYAMKMYETDWMTQRGACGAIARLAHGNAKIQRQIVEKGGVVTILHAMRIHYVESLLQIMAWKALGVLATDDESCWDGGIVAILNAMKTHETSEDVQVDSCYALAELAKFGTKSQGQIVKNGGIVAILNAMKRHETSEDVQERGALALGLLADDDENKKQITNEGGISILLAATDLVTKGGTTSTLLYGDMFVALLKKMTPKGHLNLSNGTLKPNLSNKLCALLRRHVPHLRSIDLSNNGLRRIPPSMCLLTSLTRLDLSNNQLTRVPKEIGSLVGLAPGLLFNRSGGLVLDGNPIVEPPMKTCARGVLAIRRYWDAIEADFGAVEVSYDKKVLFVGTGGAGKTSLRMNLTDGHGKRTKEGPDRATIGIDVHEMTCETATLSLWDFGGQEEYYQTHALFLTSRSIYLLVVDIAAYDLESAEQNFKVHVQQWVDKLRAEVERVGKENAVASQVSEITVVATKIDGVSDTKELDRRIQDLWNRLTKADREHGQRSGGTTGDILSSIRLPKTAGDILLVCSDDGRGVEALRAHLVALTRAQPVPMAASWMSLLESMRKLGTGPLSRVSRKDVNAAALEIAETHAKSLSKRSNASKVLKFVPDALRLLHDLGCILWYEENESLKTSIFTHPVAVVNMLKSIVRHNMRFHVQQLLDKGTLVESAAVSPGSTLRELERGVLTRRLCKVLWRENRLCESKDRKTLENLCHTLDLLIPFDGRGGEIDGFFAPFYLEELPLRREHLRTLNLPTLEFPVSPSARCRVGRLYEFELYVPSGLFCRMLVRWLKRLPDTFGWSAWRNGFRIKGGGELRAAIVWWQHPRNREGCFAFHAVAEDPRRAWKTLTPLLNNFDDVLRTYRHVEYAKYAMYWAACEKNRNPLLNVLSLDKINRVLSKSEDRTVVTVSGKTYRVERLLDMRPSATTSSPERSFVPVSKAIEAEQRADSGSKRPFLLSCEQDSKPIVHVACYFSTDGKSLWIRSGTGGDSDERSLPLRGWHHEDIRSTRDTFVPKLRLFRDNGVVGSIVFCGRASEDAEEFTQFRSVLLKKLMYLGCMMSLSYADFKSQTWRKLGSGQYGMAFSAVFYGKPVAIKAVPASKVDKKELDILKRVVGYGGHAHLVRYYGDFVQTRENDENRLCIAMEMCDTDLEKVLHASNAFEWTPKKEQWEYRDMWSRSFFWRTLRGIAVGVHFLHNSVHIVHRDLKPANVLMKRRDDGSLIPKICDFGMSKVCRHGNIVQYASGCVGTPVYTPHMDIGGYDTQYIPEKFDAYSFGMMAWEMWTRVKPFSEFAEPIEWRIKVCKEAFRPPTTSDESGAVMIPMYGNKNTPASLKWENVRLVGVCFPPKLRGLIEGCWAQRCEDRWSFDKIVSEIGDKHLLSGGSGWFGNAEISASEGGASTKIEETEERVLSNNDDALPPVVPLGVSTGGASK